MKSIVSIKKMLALSISVILLLIFSFATISSASIDSVFVWSPQSNSLSNATIGNETVTTSGNIVDLGLECGSAILMEQNSGQILYEHNIHEQLRPASVTKVMSLLLIMEALDNGQISLTDKVPCSEKAASMGGSQIWLDTRETLSVDEMLKAICVNSANDCTVAMAEYIGGSTDSFVQKMNERAKQLGMNDTTFKNCHGLDEDGHVTSSYDIALMSRELLKNHPMITNYTSIWMDTLRDGKSQLSNTNKLIRNYKGATGLKTGSTGLALYNLSASATRDNLSLIAVVMKAPTTQIRFSEAEKLLDYGFNNYSYKQFAKSGDVLRTLSVNKGVSSTVQAVYEDSSGALMQKGSEKNLQQVINLPESINAPVEKDQVIGDVTYLLDGKEIGKTNIIAEDSIKKISPTNMMEKLFFSWLRVLR